MGHSQRLNVGTSILVDKSLTPQITSNDTLLEGRAQFITLEFPDNGNLSIVNIYATRTLNERVLMWKQLSEANFNIALVIIGGDFNHLEEMEEMEEMNRRRQVGERLMLKREATS
jgi:hypothetical protein